MRLRIALIHATPVAVEPIEAAFRAGWPDVELMNVLDDSLSRDRARTRDLPPDMMVRFERLAKYAWDYGASGALFTCSAFGPAIEAAARAVPIPVLKPNEAMFDAALAQGTRIGMVATFAPSIPTMTEEFAQAARESGRAASLHSVLAEGAMDALRAGDTVRHNALVAEAAQALSGVDVIMLAQFSTSRALDAVGARVRVPVLTAPDAAVARLKAVLSGGGA